MKVNNNRVLSISDKDTCDFICEEEVNSSGLENINFQSFLAY